MRTVSSNARRRVERVGVQGGEIRYVARDERSVEARFREPLACAHEVLRRQFNQGRRRPEHGGLDREPPGAAAYVGTHCHPLADGNPEGRGPPVRPEPVEWPPSLRQTEERHPTGELGVGFLDAPLAS